MRMAVGDRVGPLGPGDLAAAYPWPDEGSWLRVMMVMTLDGAVAGADGRSGSISSTADREVLAAVRRLSDAILVGAATVRAEPYAPLRAKPDAAAERAHLGLAPAPVIVVVSRSLELPWDAPMFDASAVRPMVVTTESAGERELRAAREHADLLVLPGERVEPPVLLDRLARAGLRRLVCEGGPSLVAALVESGAVDEVDLSISPLLSGGGRPPGGVTLPDAARFALRHVITDGAFLFTRYVARGRAGSGAPA